MNLVPIEDHNRLTAGPSAWTDTRVPAEVFNVARAVYGTSSEDDDKRVYRTLQAALRKLAEPPKDFRDRVRAESAELDARIKKLAAFLPTDACHALPADEQERLCAQLAAMQDYSNCLAERIDAFMA